MTDTTEHPVAETAKEYTGGAVGAGLVLVVLPCAVLYLGIDKIGGTPLIGLPILAIFGIMILFGALALIATLFARLGLDDARQALALPEGSIRAAIALSLIVLFAIISIMLYQSIAKPYVIAGLTDEQKLAIVKDPTNHVIAVAPECRTKPPSSADCAPEDVRYSVHLRQPAGQESTDLAKQLLILIGTLMTSVTSFYFASRAAEAKRSGDGQAVGDVAPSGSPTAPVSSSLQAALAQQSAADEDLDGCNVAIVDATPDHELPPARGGVN